MAFFPMAKLILSGLFKKEATLAYPLKPIKRDDTVRGHVSIDIESCLFCGICQKKCPPDAIAVSKQDRTWEISRFSCIVCNCCVEACPKKCLRMESEPAPVVTERVKDIFKDARVSADG